ncbi:unnamed protein product [Nyctereutes procyonoides]|uniref:(raccoon dog) hypothetical protein n=1 Tax=Nyctereutes procyonoides TaxID=34880 RepID=A0A811ZMP9_NYCPR|nr:unnamed protein product [Nyctereutes procyonoides]
MKSNAGLRAGGKQSSSDHASPTAQGGSAVPARGWREEATAETEAQELLRRRRAAPTAASRGAGGPLQGAGGEGPPPAAPVPPRPSPGRGGGRAQAAGEGRSRASHNNKSQAFPTPAATPPVPRDPGGTHSGRGSVRAPSGCGVGGWRVCRSLSPGGPAPARPSSGPSTSSSGSSSAPTSGSPATQANGFRKSRPILRGLRVAGGCPLSPACGAPAAGAQVPRHAPRRSPHRPASCPLLARGLRKGHTVFPPAASLDPALLSPRRGDAIRDNTAAAGRETGPQG